MCVLYSSNVYFFQFMKSSLSILRSEISPVFMVCKTEEERSEE